MFWKVTKLAPEEAHVALGREMPGGRFVLHRHCDEAGPHLDLRLELEGYLAGWRVDGLSLDAGAWATEKMPHPVRWLEQDGEAVRVDEGEYVWLAREEESSELLLQGREEEYRVRVERQDGLSASSTRAICDALESHGVKAEAVAKLIGDGVTARQRAVERFCGLGRELDGDSFDEGVWRRTLAPLSLREVFRHLEGLEVRFDRKYPPQPVSHPEPLEGAKPEDRAGRAMEILREG